MKKTASIFLSLIVLIAFAVSTNAALFNGDDLFTVDLPEDFEATGESDGGYTFENEDGDTFSVSYAENDSEDIFCPENMSKKDIEKYTSDISAGAKEVMENYADGFDMEFTRQEKVKHQSGKTALVCEMETTVTRDGKTEVFYQTMYEFGGEDYKYTFTYTTAEEKNNDEFNKVFESINIVEDETPSKLDNLPGYALMVAVALLIVIGIVRFIRTPEKRKQGKI
ncbi:MAG: hypothetical protein ACI4VW_07190 [Acutalibacteraceae bacterium]